MKDKNPAHRPTDYEVRFNDMALVACKEGGFTDKKLALLFGCCERTINYWKKEYPDFLQSIVAGKDSFDVAVAENSLLKRIRGYKHTEVTCEPTITYEEVDEPILDDKGEPVLYVRGAKKGNAKTKKKKIPIVKMTVTKKVKKSIAPDVKAIEIHLYNRAPDRWRRVKQVELTGKGGGPIATDLGEAMKSIMDEVTGENNTKVLPNGKS